MAESSPLRRSENGLISINQKAPSINYLLNSASGSDIMADSVRSALLDLPYRASPLEIDPDVTTDGASVTESPEWYQGFGCPSSGYLPSSSSIQMGWYLRDNCLRPDSSNA